MNYPFPTQTDDVLHKQIVNRNMLLLVPFLLMLYASICVHYAIIITKMSKDTLNVFLSNWLHNVHFSTATQKIRLRAVNVAKDYKDDFTFVIADEKENSAYFRDFGFDDSSEDLNIGILSPQDRKYPMEPMEDGYDEELIREFLDNYKNG